MELKKIRRLYCGKIDSSVFLFRTILLKFLNKFQVSKWFDYTAFIYFLYLPLNMLLSSPNVSSRMPKYTIYRRICHFTSICVQSSQWGWKRMCLNFMNIEVDEIVWKQVKELNYCSISYVGLVIAQGLQNISFLAELPPDFRWLKNTVSLILMQKCCCRDVTEFF